MCWEGCGHVSFPSLIRQVMEKLQKSPGEISTWPAPGPGSGNTKGMEKLREEGRAKNLIFIQSLCLGDIHFLPSLTLLNPAFSSAICCGIRKGGSGHISS